MKISILHTTEVVGGQNKKINDEQMQLHDDGFRTLEQLVDVVNMVTLMPESPAQCFARGPELTVDGDDLVHPVHFEKGCIEMLADLLQPDERLLRYIGLREGQP